MPRLCKTAIEQFVLQDMYSEATAELPPSSDGSFEQLVKPKCSDAIAIMPRVLKVDMAPAKLPLPSKKGTRKMVDAHFRAAGGDMEGLGHIRKVCFSTRQKTGVYIWIECERDVMHKFWIGKGRKLAGETGKCEEMPKEWVKSQLQKDVDMAEKSENSLGDMLNPACLQLHLFRQCSVSVHPHHAGRERKITCIPSS